MESLAVKYRPKNFDDVVEQSATKVILQQQLESGEVKNAYLFCGGAGTGKTTCARIFANDINEGLGIPIELDAASNNSVEDVRNIIQESKTMPLDSEYKIFIIDECHALSNNAWQAFLKVLEEPPKKSIFIFCTTDPQKIPKTILSRVQRYDFQRISNQGIQDRLCYILSLEAKITPDIDVGVGTIEFIAKQAQGGMRDAITMLDKCLSYSSDLSLENVTKVLGLANYELMMGLLHGCIIDDIKAKIATINQIYSQGYDLKQFVKDFTNFVLDFCKYYTDVRLEYCSCPNTQYIKDGFEEAIDSLENKNPEDILRSLVRLQTDIKWDTNPKSRIEAWCFTGE